jgi:hypothetical protein
MDAPIELGQTQLLIDEVDTIKAAKFANESIHAIFKYVE